MIPCVQTDVIGGITDSYKTPHISDYVIGGITHSYKPPHINDYVIGGITQSRMRMSYHKIMAFCQRGDKVII